MNVQVVEPQYLHTIWVDVEKWLAEAFEFARSDYNTDHAKVYLITGMWQLIVALDDDRHVCGAATVEYINRPANRVAFITAIGGKNIVDSDKNFNQFREILKISGATTLEGACRPAVVKLFKQKLRAEEKYSIVEVKL